MEERFFTSVPTFSTDLGTVFSTGIGMSSVADTAEVQSQIIVDKSRKDLSAEQKEKRKLAKRIIKAIQPSLEDAMRKESELCRRPFEKELRDLDLLLETSISSRRDSMTGSVVEEVSDDDAEPKATNNGGAAPPSNNTTVVQPDSTSAAGRDLTNGTTTADPIAEPAAQPTLTNGATLQDPINLHALPPHQHTPEDSQPPPSLTTSLPTLPIPSTQPPTPPLTSSSDRQTALSTGGIPWYMEPFDPAGTTIFEERWTGREVARGMSEELSDMDEEELDGLVEGDVDMMWESEVPGSGGRGVDDAGIGTREERKKNGKLKKRWRGFR